MLVSWRQKVISNFCMLTYSCTHTHTDIHRERREESLSRMWFPWVITLPATGLCLCWVWLNGLMCRSAFTLRQTEWLGCGSMSRLCVCVCEIGDMRVIGCVIRCMYINWQGPLLAVFCLSCCLCLEVVYRLGSTTYSHIWMVASMKVREASGPLTDNQPAVCLPVRPTCLYTSLWHLWLMRQLSQTY